MEMSIPRLHICSMVEITAVYIKAFRHTMSGRLKTIA